MPYSRKLGYTPNYPTYKSQGDDRASRMRHCLWCGMRFEVRDTLRKLELHVMGQHMPTEEKE